MHEKQFTSFAGSRMIATGNLIEVAVQTKECLNDGEDKNILIFDDETSDPVEIDFRGPVESLVATLSQQSTQLESTQSESTPSKSSTPQSPQTESASLEGNDSEHGTRGRGRPKLGVVAREITLLPRHWDWLNQQPGGASVALRKLVEEAKRANLSKELRRNAQDSTYKFMSAMAGNLEGFEEATRALFAVDATRFSDHIENWPVDIKTHLKKISKTALELSTSQK